MLGLRQSFDALALGLGGLFDLFHEFALARLDLQIAHQELLLEHGLPSLGGGKLVREIALGLLLGDVRRDLGQVLVALGLGVEHCDLGGQLSQLGLLASGGARHGSLAVRGGATHGRVGFPLRWL